MSYRYRCKRRTNGVKCDKRVTLKRKVEDYKRPPKCPSCGKTLSYIDKSKTKTCYCDGLHFPHRAGSVVWCTQHPTGPTEEDYIERYGDE